MKCHSRYKLHEVPISIPSRKERRVYDWNMKLCPGHVFMCMTVGFVTGS